MHIFYILYKDDPSSGGSFRVAQGLIKGIKDLDCTYTICFVYGSKGVIGKDNPENCVYLDAIPRYGYLSFIKFLAICGFKVSIIKRRRKFLSIAKRRNKCASLKSTLLRNFS